MTKAWRHLRTSGLRRCASISAAALGLALMSTSAMADVAVLGTGSALTEDHRSPPAIHRIQAQQNPATRAREQALIGRLEEEIRRLTGRIEQLEYEQRSVNRRVDQLVEDLDQRLRALEGGGGEQQQAQQALDDLAASAAGSDSSGDDASSGEGVPPGDEASSGDGQLGSVPESAVDGLPRPDPAEVAAPRTSTLTPEQQYENAVQLLQAGDYQGAQGGLEVFLDLNGDHQLAANAAYWLAETHYVRQNYSAAAAAFARNYGTYGENSSKAIDNLLKLGMSLSSLGDRENACVTFDKLAEVFPSRPAHIEQALSRERARARCS